MSADDVVIINDDNQRDSDIEIVEIPKEQDTIVIDDDIIEIVDVDKERNNKEIKDYLIQVCSENTIIGDFIEKCLDIENSSGMLRVIYRTFLPLYFKMEDGYRESQDYKKAIDMTLRALEVYPNLKFSHLKFICDIMKSKSRDRKKVKFTTLSSNVRGTLSSNVTAKSTKPTRKRRKRRKLTSVKNSKKRRMVNVIDIAESSDGDHKCDEPTALDNQKTDDVVVLEDDNEISNTSNKENKIVEHCTASSIQNLNIEQSGVDNHHSKWTPSSEPSHPTVSDKMYNEALKRERIKKIEMLIEYYKKTIDSLEQKEVTTDSVNSPYIRCERVKAHIVSLYKELCSLTGDEPVRKREIHFSATDGRPQLPLKMLEEFINENIGSDGNPCLPDFYDVVKCVCEANESAGLGWDKPRIWNEARALFTYCGHAMQESRKKREWRYMVGLANSRLDDDPAERDPVLMARLEANRRIAVKKEIDLLEKYVKLEEGRYDGQSITSEYHVSQDCSDEDAENDAAPTSDPNIGRHVYTTLTSHVNHYGLDNVPLNSENNMGYISACTIYDASYKRFANTVQEMAVKQSQNCPYSKTNTRTLEISMGSNDNPNFRLLTEMTANETDTSQENKQPEANVIGVAINDGKETTEQESRIDAGTFLVEFDNNIHEKNLETFEDTYKDFVKSRNAENLDQCNINNNSIMKPKSKNKSLVIKDVYSVGNQNGTCSKSYKNVPLVIKDVYSVATKSFENIQSNSGQLPVLTEQNSLSEQVQNANVEKSNLATENIMIKEVYSVSNKQDGSSANSLVVYNSDKTAPPETPIIKAVYSEAIKQSYTRIQSSELDKSNTEQLQDKSKGIWSDENDKNKGTVSVSQSETDDLLVNTKKNDDTRSETQSNVEENVVKVKKEISDILKDMESFGDSFTATVFDIEDPFLVIEISDSSDESDDDMDR